MTKINVTEEQVLLMIDMYEQRISLKEIGKKLGFSKWKATQTLKEAGVVIRNSSESKYKYFVDDDYFEVIDTESKAYWLGFIAADGCVKSNNAQLTIALAQKDKDHLEKFKIDTSSSHPIRSYFAKGQYEYCSINIVSSKIKSDLQYKHITPRKSKTLEFNNIVEHIPNELIHHFVRGYFDGDGSVYIDSLGRWHISILGTQMFLDEMLELIGFKTRVVKDARCDVYYINIAAQKEVARFLHYIYKDATIYLERKYQKWLLAKEVQLGGNS